MSSQFSTTFQLLPFQRAQIINTNIQIFKYKSDRRLVQFLTFYLSNERACCPHAATSSLFCILTRAACHLLKHDSETMQILEPSGLPGDSGHGVRRELIAQTNQVLYLSIGIFSPVLSTTKYSAVRYADELDSSSQSKML